MNSWLVVACAAALSACAETRAGTDPPLFEKLSAERTGIAFQNRVPDDSIRNILNHLFFYNGGGVAVGDINNDGLPDLYFTSNLEQNRLYLNRGNYRFEDITERAGVGGAPGWTAGATMADVDGDGYVDIYVSGVQHLSLNGRNVLYVNDGDGTFTDRTREYGLEHQGYSTQALFFDYDRDGDLDMYLLNYSVHGERAPSSAPQRAPRHSRAGDRLFRNTGKTFVDVSEQARIHSGVEGYGLGVVASDFDVDGCIDLFVANDFQENDFLYRNNCDGTFTESIASAMAHTSRFSMGADAGDVNNDGRPDLVVLDMLPDREEILKTSANAERADVFALKTRAGYHPQYARNTLQLNRGGGLFSEIGYLAGVFATDWSWSALFADFDADGRKDLFVTNGIYRRPNDLDYIAHVGQEAVQRSLANQDARARLALLDRMPSVPLSNHAYRNNGDLTFTNVAEQWGLAEPGFSNGAAYVDLNNTGVLDLVVNNLNAPAAIYRNRAREIHGHHFLVVQLRGEGGNTAGIGTKLAVKHGGTRQFLEQQPTRGFQSSVDHRLHLGLGADAQVDSVLVVWPDGRYQLLTDVPADQTLVLAQSDASGNYAYAGDAMRVSPSPAPSLAAPLFRDVTGRTGLDFRHREGASFDLVREPLIPHALSREGPAMAVADVNGDGLDDVFVGGAKWQPAALYLQQKDGRFRETPTPSFRADSLHEDVDAAFFDADGDGDQDLYVVSGGNEFWGSAEALRDRLYMNDGHGRMTRAPDALPSFFENGGCVTPGDFDGDGDVDLFVGSRVTAREYGVVPRSYLLFNDGGGRFADVTRMFASGLQYVGMVTDAAAADVNGDGRSDLIVVGEWMPVRVFVQKRLQGVRPGGTPVFGLEDATDAFGLRPTAGWWNGVEAGDLDGDGDTDLVIGNLGLNSYIKAAPSQPARLYVHDFGQTGSTKPILTTYKNGVSYPIHGRDEILTQIPSLAARFPTYASFGARRVEELFPAAELRAATVLEARTFASSVAINDGRGTFRVTPLPVEAQFAPVYASVIRDFDGDGAVDIVLGGNFSGVTPLRGAYDASFGLMLKGDGTGRFAAVDAPRSGIAISGEVRDLQVLRGPEGQSLAVARNDDTMLLWQWQSSASPSPPLSSTP